MQTKSHTQAELIQAIRAGLTIVLYDTAGDDDDDVMFSDEYGDAAIEEVRLDVLDYEDRGDGELREGASLEIAEAGDIEYLLEVNFGLDDDMIDQIFEERAKAIFDRALGQTVLGLRLEPVTLDQYAENSADEEQTRMHYRAAVAAARNEDPMGCLDQLRLAQESVEGLIS